MSENEDSPLARVLQEWFLQDELCLSADEPCRRWTCSICIYSGVTEGERLA